MEGVFRWRSLIRNRTNQVECQSRRCLIACFCFSPLLALTACSSPCTPPPPAVILRPGVTLRADPNPVIPAAGSKTGKTTVYWKAPVKEVQLRLGAPKRTLWATDQAPATLKLALGSRMESRFTSRTIRRRIPLTPARHSPSLRSSSSCRSCSRKLSRPTNVSSSALLFGSFLSRCRISLNY